MPSTTILMILGWIVALAFAGLLCGANRAMDEREGGQ